MATLTEGRHAAEFIIQEEEMSRSRANVTLAASQTIVPGRVLGKISTGAVGGGAQTVGTPVVTGAANGAPGTWTGDALAPAGNYIIEITGAAGATAAFNVFKPDGTLDGVGNVGTAYNGSINGTLADGSTDWGPGMYVTIPVSYADSATAGLWGVFDEDNTDGTQNAAGIAIYGIVTGVGEVTTKTAVLVRDSVVNGHCLTWSSGITDGEKAAAMVQLEALGIIVRN